MEHVKYFHFRNLWLGKKLNDEECNITIALVFNDDWSTVLVGDSFHKCKMAGHVEEPYVKKVGNSIAYARATSTQALHVHFTEFLEMLDKMLDAVLYKLQWDNPMDRLYSCNYPLMELANMLKKQISKGQIKSYKDVSYSIILRVLTVLIAYNADSYPKDKPLSSLERFHKYVPDLDLTAWWGFEYLHDPDYWKYEYSSDGIEE